MGVFRIADKENGDNHLSIFERNLWALTYSCLYRFGCPVIFHVYGPMAQHRIDQEITFFVPRDNEQCNAVKEFLQKELEGQIRAGEQITETEYAFGCGVTIMEFEGIDFYLERDVIDELSHRALAALMKKLNPPPLN